MIHPVIIMNHITIYSSVRTIGRQGRMVSLVIMLQGYHRGVFEMFDLTSDLLKQITLGEDSILELKTVEFTGNKVSGLRRMKG